MPMTEFPRFAMGDSGACSGKRACHLANSGAFPLLPVANQGWQSGRASRRVALLKIMESGIGRIRLDRATRNGTHSSKSVAPNRDSRLFANTAIQQTESPVGAQASMPVFRPPR